MKRPRTSLPAAAAALLLAGCGGSGEAPAPSGKEGRAPASSPAAPPPAPGSAAGAPVRWDLKSSGEGAALALLAASGPPAIRLVCPAGKGELLINVPGFRPIASEERLSFGSGGHVVALVADPAGDSRRGGVSATGPVPADLAVLIGGPLSASYGAQESGPHAAPPSPLARDFVAACRSAAAADPPPAPGKPANPCMVQDGRALGIPPMQAVGTEPFWAARIEGRCVTYSHPEDLKGIRVWTRYTPRPGGGGTWSGALGGRRFELAARSRPGCSDGMSDRKFPLEVELTVEGERRTGCAGPPP